MSSLQHDTLLKHGWSKIGREKNGISNYVHPKHNGHIALGTISFTHYGDGISEKQHKLFSGENSFSLSPASLPTYLQKLKSSQHSEQAMPANKFASPAASAYSEVFGAVPPLVDESEQHAEVEQFGEGYTVRHFGRVYTPRGASYGVTGEIGGLEAKHVLSHIEKLKEGESLDVHHGGKRLGGATKLRRRNAPFDVYTHVSPEIEKHLASQHAEEESEQHAERKFKDHGYKVGDTVRLHDEALQHHARSIPAHLGYTKEGFAWQDTLRKLQGKVGKVSRVFPNSQHINVDYPEHGTIGIDAKSIVRHVDQHSEEEPDDQPDINLPGFVAMPGLRPEPPIQFAEDHELQFHGENESPVKQPGHIGQRVHSVAHGPRGKYRITQNRKEGFDAFHTVHGKEEEYLGSGRTRAAAIGIARRHHTQTKHLPLPEQHSEEQFAEKVVAGRSGILAPGWNKGKYDKKFHNLLKQHGGTTHTAHGHFTMPASKVAAFHAAAEKLGYQNKYHYSIQE